MVSIVRKFDVDSLIVMIQLSRCILSFQTNTVHVLENWEQDTLAVAFGDMAHDIWKIYETL
jgi:hypothetical protein